MIIVKNTTENNISINDLSGQILPAKEQINLTDLYSIFSITSSKDLKVLVVNETVIVNDGVNDLPVDSGLDHLIFRTKYQEQITPFSWSIGPTPPSISVKGAGWYNTNNNYVYVYDLSRKKWLSIVRHNYVFVYNGPANDVFMKIGVLLHSDANYSIPREACITGIGGSSSKGSKKKEFEVHKAPYAIVGNFTMHDHSHSDSYVNIDLENNDKLALKCCFSSSPIINPIVILEVAWRYSKV